MWNKMLLLVLQFSNLSRNGSPERGIPLPLQAHLPGQSLHTDRVERGPMRLPGQHVWRLFLSPNHKKCSSNKKKSVSALGKTVYLQLFWLPISKGLRTLRPPLEAGGGEQACLDFVFGCCRHGICSRTSETALLVCLLGRGWDVTTETMDLKT